MIQIMKMCGAMIQMVKMCGGNDLYSENVWR